MEAVLDQPLVSAPVSITDTALAQFLVIRQQENIPEDYMLRVGVKGGGCSGYTYVLGFDQAQENDDIYEVKFKAFPTKPINFEFARERLETCSELYLETRKFRRLRKLARFAMIFIIFICNINFWQNPSQ